MNYKFIDRDGWDKAADVLWAASERGETVGLDSEFYGEEWNGSPYDVRKMSPAGGRARVHMWSVAVRRKPLRLTPRGYHVADGAVMLAPALLHPSIRSWLESDAPKVAHNLSVDFHAIASHGVTLGGTVDSLEHARWVWPERARGRGFSLDSLGHDVLGVGKTQSFDDVFSEEVTVQVRTKVVKRTECSCGVAGCRKRKGHEKMTHQEEIPVMKTLRQKVPLESVVPGHPKWAAALEYSARDAVLAVNLYEKIEQEMGKRVVWPW